MKRTKTPYGTTLDTNPGKTDPTTRSWTVRTFSDLPAKSTKDFFNETVDILKLVEDQLKIKVVTF